MSEQYILHFEYSGPQGERHDHEQAMFGELERRLEARYPGRDIPSRPSARTHVCSAPDGFYVFSAIIKGNSVDFIQLHPFRNVHGSADAREGSGKSYVCLNIHDVKEIAQRHGFNAQECKRPEIHRLRA